MDRRFACCLAIESTLRYYESIPLDTLPPPPPPPPPPLLLL
jgi:hypothetical protein